MAVHSNSSYCATENPSVVCSNGGATLYQYYRTKICGNGRITGKVGRCNTSDSTGTPLLPHIVTLSLHFTQPATHKPSTLYKEHGLTAKVPNCRAKCSDHRTGPTFEVQEERSTVKHRTVGFVEVAAVYLRMVVWCNRRLRGVACCHT